MEDSDDDLATPPPGAERRSGRQPKKVVRAPQAIIEESEKESEEDVEDLQDSESEEKPTLRRVNRQSEEKIVGGQESDEATDDTM